MPDQPERNDGPSVDLTRRQAIGRFPLFGTRCMGDERWQSQWAVISASNVRHLGLCPSADGSAWRSGCGRKIRSTVRFLTRLTRFLGAGVGHARCADALGSYGEAYQKIA